MHLRFPPSETLLKVLKQLVNTSFYWAAKADSDARIISMNLHLPFIWKKAGEG